MSANIFPAFTGPSRRKRIATYGKGSRLSAQFNWNDDASATSPERRRKQAGTLSGATRATADTGTSKVGSISLGNRESPSDPPPERDPFDVPSDDELRPGRARSTVKKAPRKLPAKTPPEPASKTQAPTDDFDIPSSDDEAVLPQRRRGKTPQASQSQATKAAPPVPALRKKPEPAPHTSSDDIIASPRALEKTRQAASQNAGNGGAKPVQAAKPPAVRRRGISRGTTPAPPIVATKATAKGQAKSPATKKAAAKPPAAVDPFDVPSSEEEAPIITPGKPRSLLQAQGQPHPFTRPSTATVLGNPIDSDGSNASNASKKRKRNESTQKSAGPAGVPSAKDESKSSEALPNAKAQKTASSATASHRGKESRHIAPVVAPDQTVPVVNKPRRARQRAAPVTPRAPVAKNQSSPAKLHSMLAVRSVPSPTATAARAEPAPVDDVTMYDIPDSSTPIAKPAKTPVCGMVTPVQKDIFSTLLKNSADAPGPTPGLPSIGRLQLTSRKPNLGRSSSDIPQSSHTRTRLIDTLRKAASSSENEDSESDEETEQDIIDIPAESKSPSEVARVKQTVDLTAEDANMDIDSGPPSQSQNSQNALHATASKITYARQRSYREDPNADDGLLLTMDLDLDGTFDKQQEPVSEDEDETSQVKDIYALRREGENHRFLMEAQSSIDEIADTAGLGKSVQRTAILDFCTRMADKEFLGRLLDSALLLQLLCSMSYTGEIIFDFAACVAVALVLEARSDVTILETVDESLIERSLIKLLDFDNDISRIAKQRQTNLSKLGREAVENFRNLVLSASIWSYQKPEGVSPQLVALRALELFVLGQRKAGAMDGILEEDAVTKILDATTKPIQRLKAGEEMTQDIILLNSAYSTLESLSVSPEWQTRGPWSNNTLKRLAATIPAIFESAMSGRGISPNIKLATRLCILLTNNKPKACDIFARPSFVKPLVEFINYRFAQLGASDDAEAEAEAREDLILSLGAMINIAEFSDQARESVLADGDALTEPLVLTFLEGSERAAQAESLENTQANIPVGYLTVLLGNLCLNETVRNKVRSYLPGRNLDLLVEKVKEFVSFHERVDRLTGQFEGEQGREVSRNFTKRLLQVVRKLERAGAGA